MQSLALKPRYSYCYRCSYFYVSLSLPIFEILLTWKPVNVGPFIWDLDSVINQD